MGWSEGIRNGLSSRMAVVTALGLAGVGCAANTSGSNGTGDSTMAQGATVQVPGMPAGTTTVVPGSNGSTMTGSPGSSVPAVGAVPCEVDTVVKSRCQTCHGASPIGGAPMSLVTLADFQQTYTVKSTQVLLGRSMKLYDLARIRINGEMNTMKMPQGSPLAPADFTMLNGWLVSGAPGGTACTASAPGGSVMPGSSGGTTTGGAGMGGTAATGTGKGNRVITPDTPDQCANDPTQFMPLTARPGETCYEFQSHGVSSPTDNTKFTVPTDESYNQFYFAVPWPAGTVATRFGARFDNLKVLHHWLGFTSSAGTAPGTVATNVTGTTLGENAELVGGWAVGGCNVEFPADMGLKLPDSGEIMIQWHHYNTTGAPAQDASAVQWCTVPASMRANIGGLTFLGTEDFNSIIGMPPGMNQFGTTCTNNSGKPITIVGFNPHLHLLGTRMTSVVQKATGGSMETVFDHAFQFDHQVNYMLNPGYVLQPGDSITSTCTFNNTTTANVAFGQSTKQEMCYQFTFAYPYGALNNGVLSLIGATNTCW